MIKNTASLVKSTNHFEGVQSSLRLLEKDLKSTLSKISSVVIKINFVDTRVELSTTPFEAVKGFVYFIQPFYKGEIIIAEGATWGTKINAFEKYGFTKLAKENSQIKLLDLNTDKLVEKKLTYPQGEFSLPMSKTILKTPFLVSIARPKTHNRVVMTASIKNVLVGVVPGYTTRLKIHKGKFIHHVMTSIAQYAYPDFVVIDGTIGMEGDGPVGKGTKKNANWVISSFDALAADSLATYLMGFSINDVGYLNLLYQKKYGVLYPKDKIKILGENPKKLINPFKPHKNFEKQRRWQIT
jgi:uncharacterized protein (DUF362 family)